MTSTHQSGTVIVSLAVIAGAAIGYAGGRLHTRMQREDILQRIATLDERYQTAQRNNEELQERLDRVEMGRTPQFLVCPLSLEESVREHTVAVRPDDDIYALIPTSGLSPTYQRFAGRDCISFAQFREEVQP